MLSSNESDINLILLCNDNTIKNEVQPLIKF